MGSVATGQRKGSIEPCERLIEPFCRHPERDERNRQTKAFICAPLGDEPLQGRLQSPYRSIELPKGGPGSRDLATRGHPFGKSQKRFCQLCIHQCRYCSFTRAPDTNPPITRPQQALRSRTASSPRRSGARTTRESRVCRGPARSIGRPAGRAPETTGRPPW